MHKLCTYVVRWQIDTNDKKETWPDSYDRANKIILKQRLRNMALLDNLILKVLRIYILRETFKKPLDLLSFWENPNRFISFFWEKTSSIFEFFLRKPL